MQNQATSGLGAISQAGPVSPNVKSAQWVGHGPQVDGTIASKTWGVAKKAQVIAVKAWRRSRVMSVGESILAKQPARAVCEAFSTKFHGASAQGVLSIIEVGVAVDISRVLPARTARAIPVAAIAINNTAWQLSNLRSGADLYASGVDIYSLSLEASKDAALSGTFTT
ncbi:alkaline proteinase precursor [Colletotrichum scovillei]|uniref:Alkaline proteinase n=1 Tax=Colletotrichum scovillei TaxID=1209932 RepID=A0A9P7QQS9_9PEZI|nr:alkaline proteinase precursor [Colletotrichum scovillei]KAG7040529.1 alkaline proteinase precursor [Colletotrichum scovillei]KAG7060577.1 alkaline proteinase precursor [Colletotrichum scovillei]